MTQRVFREDKDTGHLVPVPQVARPQARLSEVVRALRGFAQEAAVEDRCLITPAQAQALVDAVGDAEARERLLEQLAEQDAEITRLKDQVARLNAEAEARLAADRQEAARLPDQGVALTVHAGGDMVMTFALASGRVYQNRDPVDEPAHSLGAALLDVAVREWAGMARPAAQRAQDGP